MKVMPVKPPDKGLLLSSHVDFTIPSPFAREHLYYLIQYGCYQCVPGYEVRRDFLDMFLCIYVRSGALHAVCGDRTADAAAGQLVLMDCRLPHRYYVTEPTEILWFHFAGNESAAYVRLLTDEHGICFDGNREISRCFEQIFHYGDKQLYNEHRISVYIQSVLCCLAVPDTKQDIPEVIRPAVEYIAEHFREEVTLETLAVLCHVSVTHLIRCFTRYVGFRPHDYLQEQRLRHAKVLLTGSSLSIEQIAEQSGFNSASHFSRVFRSREKMTPSAFRAMNF